MILTGAYYTLTLSDDLRIVVLNTNLYYYTNELTAQMPDPANQLQWLDDILTAANQNAEKVRNDAVKATLMDIGRHFSTSSFMNFRNGNEN